MYTLHELSDNPLLTMYVNDLSTIINNFNIENPALHDYYDLLIDDHLIEHKNGINTINTLKNISNDKNLK